MLSWLRHGIIQKSISSVLITCMLATSTVSLAAVIPQNDVNAGQSAGMEFLGGAQTPPTVSNGTSGLDDTSDNTQLFLGDFMPGVNGSPDTSSLEALADDPEGLVASGMVLRTAQKEMGCRTTNLVRRKTAQTVHTIRAVWRDAGGIETPATFNGSFRVNYPTLGIAKRSEIEIQKASGSTPALVLKYEHTPFQKPSNTHFTYSPTIVGAVSGAFTSIGSPENSFTFQGAFTASNASVIEIKADLFEVERTFTIQAGTCPADPETTCAHQGINLCHPATASLAKYFVRKEEQGENDFGVIGLELSRLASNAKDPDAEFIGDAAAATLDGATPEYAELFSGCTKSETTEQTTIDQHVEQIIACQSVWAPQGVCQQQRKVTAVKTGQVARFHIFKTDVDRAGSWQEPSYSENVRVDFQLWPMVGGSPYSVNYQLPNTASTGEAVQAKIAPDSSTVSIATAGKSFFYPVVVVGDGADLQWVSYGNVGNNWTPTVNIRVGTTYTIDFEEYLITTDEILEAGSSCNFISRAIQDGQCPSSGIPSSCVLPSSDGLINNAIPMGGAGAGIGSVAGDNAGMPSSCMISSINPMSCQPADLLLEYQANVDGPGWLDNCHKKGTFLNPGGVAAATDICFRKSDMDSCIEVGGNTSTCYMKELFFDCGQDKERPVVTEVHVQETCGSPIRCLGTECANTVGEANSDLGKAMAAGNMVEALSQDLTCEETGQPPTGPYDTCTIRVFVGDFKECRTPVMSGGGVAPDCCEEGVSAAAGAGVGPVQAVMAFDAAKKLVTNQQFTNMLGNMPGSSYVEGAWEATKTVINTITEPITSFVSRIGEKVLGDASMEVAKEGLAGTGGSALTNFALKMATSVNTYLDSIGMDAVGDLLFNTATKEAGAQVTSLAGPASTLIGALNAAMLIYSLAQIAGQLLYGCEDEEYELGMERQKKNCHYVGEYCSKDFPSALGGGCEIHNKSFCCYQSPLNRIIAEQMRMQFGGYGDASAPNCNGFTLEEINSFDWASLDLSEWEQLLEEAGILPENDQEAEDKWGMDADRGYLAANGPSFGSDGAVSPVELVEDRLEGSEALYEDARDELSTQQACSYAGGIQWYGAPQTFQDTEEVVDVYTVINKYKVNSSYYGPCSGGDPDSVTTRVVHNIDTGADTASAIYACDGGSLNVGTVENLTLLEVVYKLNGEVIASLPSDAYDGRCLEAPSEQTLEPFFTTHAGGSTQVVNPTCKTASEAWAVTSTTNTSYVNTSYQLRKHTITALPVSQTAENCINPAAP